MGDCPPAALRRCWGQSKTQAGEKPQLSCLASVTVAGAAAVAAKPAGEAMPPLFAFQDESAADEERAAGAALSLPVWRDRAY